MSVEELENLRIAARNKLITSIVVGTIVVLLSFTVQNIVVTLVAVTLTLTFGGIYSSKPINEFKKNFKDTFVLTSLNSVFSNLKYDPNKGIDYSVISNTRMMNMGDRFSSNDYISAKYKNINFEQADVHIEERETHTDSDGHTHETWVTLFRGRWMVFDFNKSFKADLQLCQKKFHNARISNWGNELKFKKVKMEDQSFNKEFRIYAQEEHEAFYILTPHLMEKIKNLTSSIKGSLLFCFKDNKLHVGLHNNKDSFEHSIFRKIDQVKIMESISNDIKLITSFVDELSLDNDLFKKGGN